MPQILSKYACSLPLVTIIVNLKIIGMTNRIFFFLINPNMNFLFFFFLVICTLKGMHVSVCWGGRCVRMRAHMFIVISLLQASILSLSGFIKNFGEISSDKICESDH